ncbi:MAG: tyrosine-protein kinase family protein [Betaproteobacteria bacterium]|nr:tyrosine-protein kinase family protein [Betaproteobacteria bacterium]
MSLIERAAQRLEELRRTGAALKPRAHIASASPELSTHAPAEVAPEHLKASPEQPAKTTQRHFDLDFTELARRAFVTPDLQRSRVAEEFRIIKRPLIQNAVNRPGRPLKNGNLIMVTSAVPGEGKTFTSVNLAMSIVSELNKTVLLVDADVARPSLPNVLGIPTGPGLMDLLDNPATEMADVLIRTNVENLSLLSSGNPHARATELLASDAMSRLLDDMAQRYPDRIVIFDSPPLLVTTESRELARHAGQVVVVVHAESTLQADVQRALSTIEQCPVKLLVLNQARTLAQGAYGYGYGYGYGR